MKPFSFLILIASVFVATADAARAADLPLRPTLDAAVPDLPAPPSRFFVHVGPAGLILDEGAKIKAAGNHVPGGTVRIPPQVTASVEAGYFLTPNWAVAVTLGVPPAPSIYGAGTLAGLGKLGSIVYGPTALTAQYHFTSFGPVQPYVGVGPLGMIVFSEDDAALNHLRVDSALGGVIQGGADLMLTDRWGMFFDVKKGLLRTTAKGTLGPVPISAQVRLDPLVLSGGATYRF